ncbi:heat shock protein 30-like [Gouania willdenowi]|uniref:heat shock protein 30-like n=1 Tax=Gouania willdenowi TaxID=441366 RepID=UPI0010563EF4|nr:heat shock protein 30-like [Gouania willdenowi]
MLRSHVFLSPLSPFRDVYWPVRSLWPEVRPLLHQRNLQDLHSSLQLMDELQHSILEQTEPFQSCKAMSPSSYELEKDGKSFSLTLDTRGFSPDQLSVKQVGRNLRVSGKKEKKQEDGRGFSSYTLQEFRQDLNLPEGLNPEAVTCCLSADGKLHIQADKDPRGEEAERELIIRRSSGEETQQSVCSQAENSSTHTSSHTQAEHKD